MQRTSTSGRFAASFLDDLEPRFERSTSLTLVRTEEQLYVTTGGTTLESTRVHSKLHEPAAGA